MRLARSACYELWQGMPYPRRETYRMAAPATLGVASHRVPSQPTVLVVDDDETLRLVLVDYLADGYRVLEAEDADAAVEVLRSNEVEFILSDIRMPGSMDGFAFAGWLRANRPGPAQPTGGRFPSLTAP
jgi:PleD family two-component response regulator